MTKVWPSNAKQNFGLASKPNNQFADFRGLAMITNTFAKHPFLSILAAIGILALLAVLGMVSMHIVMADGFSAMGDMWAGCQNMMAGKR